MRFCSLLLVLATPALADYSGPIRVVDGDTIHVGDVTVRLHGIDAPEVAQMCDDAEGRPWPCGAVIRETLATTYDGQIATCTERDRDRYGRSVAKCYVDGRDLAGEIVANGWAEAYRRYSMDYDLAEKAAQVQGVGLWAGTMQSPAAFRADQRAAQPQAQEAPDNCLIKGNISASGQIYHMPHNRDYANTRINEARGERWFCSEDEARAAGWRPARN